MREQADIDGELREFILRQSSVEPSGSVRTALVLGAQEFRDDAFVPVLQRLAARDEHAFVRKAAERALSAYSKR
jgi:hypothetical protein